MARQFLFQSAVVFNQREYYFAFSSDSIKLGYSMLLKDIQTYLKCKRNDFYFRWISIECKINDDLPF
ncbi:MAG: hypothetical protein J6S67_23850 [Methanobrevibacter sp.]|nr:hypothetical protein [Methanobrevibacter sp.]